MIRRSKIKYSNWLSNGIVIALHEDLCEPYPHKKGRPTLGYAEAGSRQKYKLFCSG